MGITNFLEGTRRTIEIAFKRIIVLTLTKISVNKRRFIIEMRRMTAINPLKS